MASHPRAHQAEGSADGPESGPLLRVCTPEGRILRFTDTLHVGRGEECEVRVDHPLVSRRHLLISNAGGVWAVQDLHSSNGTFVDGQRFEGTSVTGPLSLSLGRNGPSLTLELEQPGSQRPPAETRVEYPDRADVEGPPDEDYAKRYFGAHDDDQAAGPRTVMIRKAFKQVQKEAQKKHRRAYGTVVVVALLLVVGAAVYAYRSYAELQKQQATARELFYQMKELDVSIANLEMRLMSVSSPEGQDEIRKFRQARRQQEQNYDQFAERFYGRNLNAEGRLILRVTRMFGECEIASPPEYIDEVRRYIRMWQSSGRFTRALTKAKENNYIPLIAKEFMAQNLPPQYFYLAMQESSFDAFAIGPQTRWGIAKGMWQFIPETGERFGLKSGPLSKVRRPDADDDRHRWDKATTAAARYIKEIYSTDAEASGLLVMASYNWGEARVIDLVRKLSKNPRERNFWKLLERYRENIPGQTYEYVFYIVSAAVIGENPRMFGFDFDNPLAFAEAQQAGAP